MATDSQPYTPGLANGPIIDEKVVVVPVAVETRIKLRQSATEVLLLQHRTSDRSASQEPAHDLKPKSKMEEKCI